MTITELPVTVPCSRKHLNDGKPCGECRVCRKAVNDPAYSYQWGVTDEPPPKPPAPEPPRRPRPGSPLGLRKLGGRPPIRGGGAGTELKAIFAAARCAPCQQCRETAEKMDRNGPKWCEANLAELVAEIKENKKSAKCFPNLVTFAIQEWSLSKKLAHASPDEWLPILVREAIDRALAKHRQFEWVSNADLARDVQDFVSKLPVEEIGCVVGIPRSGMIPASQLAALLHVPLYQLHGEQGVVALSGGKRTGDLRRTGRPLIIDDSVNSGRQVSQARVLYRATRPYDDNDGIDWSKPIWSAMYVTPGSQDAVDVLYKLAENPHFFEWNLPNSGLLGRCILDFDGILCRDIAPEDDDDGERYLRALREAQPNWVCRKHPISMIVTARLERYRPETMEWLERHGMQVRDLVMGPWESKAERDQHSIAEYKAKHYAESDFDLFIESDYRQSARIFGITQRPVLCPTAGIFQ